MLGTALSLREYGIGALRDELPADACAEGSRFASRSTCRRTDNPAAVQGSHGGDELDRVRVHRRGERADGRLTAAALRFDHGALGFEGHTGIRIAEPVHDLPNRSVVL